MTMSSGRERRQRADGIKTREAIVSAAASLATVEGLDHLSIGGLAEDIGISKSGLFAHFRSKEALQLATVDCAWGTFDQEVVARAREAGSGRATVIALVDAFTDYLERRVFPGGCFFAATTAEAHALPAPVTARLAEFDEYWLGLLRADIEAGQAAGEIDPDEDPDQLTYEVESHVLHAHLAFGVRADPAALDRTRRAVRRLLGVPIGP